MIKKYSHVNSYGTQNKGMGLKFHFPRITPDQIPTTKLPIPIPKVAKHAVYEYRQASTCTSLNLFVYELSNGKDI
jgi:hypothetical protein